MSAQVLAPCKVTAGPNIPQVASAAGLSFWTRGVRWSLKVWRCQEPRAPTRVSQPQLGEPQCLGFQKGHSSFLLLVTHLFQRACFSPFVLQFFQSHCPAPAHNSWVDPAHYCFPLCVVVAWCQQRAGGL